MSQLMKQFHILTALSEAAVQHEPLDEALPHSDCTLYVTTMKHEAEDITAVKS
jgi:hypothetical protein